MTYSVVPGVLRPSNAERWGPDRCPFSFQAEQAFPEDTTTEEAREGTAAHHWSTEAVQGRVLPVGSVAPNGWVIDGDMVDNGQLFFDTVQKIRAAASSQRTEGVEVPVTMHTYVHAHNEGTPDYFLLDYGRRRVDVVDYKYGHRPHDPYRHFQTVDYFAGVVEGSGLTRQDTLNWTVALTIVQPRSFVSEGPVRTWEAPAAQVWEVVGELAAAAQKAKQPNAVAKTGEWCRDCSARHACDAYARASGAAMDVARQSTVDGISVEAQGRELLLILWAMERLRGRATGLEAQLTAAIQSGRPVAGWETLRSPGNEKWTIPDADVITLAASMGVQAAKTKALTPNQARDAGLPAEIVAALSRRPLGDLKLKPVNQTAARKAFGR